MSSHLAYHWFRSMQPRLITHSSDGTSSITGKVDDVARAVIDRAGADPFRPRRRRALHEEERPGGAVRIALHHHRAVADVRQQDVRDVGVVLNQAALRDAALRPERLAQVGQPHLACRRRSASRCRRRSGDLNDCAVRSRPIRDTSWLRALGGRWPWRVAPASGTYSSSRPAVDAAQHQAAAAHVAAADEMRAGTSAARRRSAAAARRTCRTRCCRAARPRSRDRRPSSSARAPCSSGCR